jgi:hypothetical protein
MIPPRNDVPWPETQRMARRDEVLSPATQVMDDRDAYLGQRHNDVGRRVSDDQVELFVAGDTAGSLQREFEQHRPEFIAVHDVGTSASLRLLASLAAAAGTRVQRLMIRRQGHGVALAVLQFVEVPLGDGSKLKLYSTDLNSDGTTRQALARVLLAWSRLGVLLCGDVSSHAMTAALRPLHDAIHRGPWPNRELLLVPLGPGAPLAAQSTYLTGGSPVSALVTPTALRPKHIWGYIGGAWNRLRAQTGPQDAAATAVAGAPHAPPRVDTPEPQDTESTTTPMPMRLSLPPSMPPHAAPAPAAVPRPPLDGPPAAVVVDTPGAPPTATPLAQRAMPTPGRTDWQGYVERCLAIKGALSGCVFDSHSMQPLAAAGDAPSAERLAQQGSALLAAMTDATRALGLTAGRTEAAISTADHHLILRPVPGHPGVALHLVLQASGGNLVLARMQLDRIAPPQ